MISSIRDVASIAATESLQFDYVSDSQLRFRFDSAVVTVGLHGKGDQQILQIASTVVRSLSSTMLVSILEYVNTLNKYTEFGTWFYDHFVGQLRFELKLLAIGLQRESLLIYLVECGRIADLHDDRIKQALGGLRSID